MQLTLDTKLDLAKSRSQAQKFLISQPMTAPAKKNTPQQTQLTATFLQNKQGFNPIQYDFLKNKKEERYKKNDDIEFYNDKMFNIIHKNPKSKTTPILVPVKTEIPEKSNTLRKSIKIVKKPSRKISAFSQGRSSLFGKLSEYMKLKINDEKYRKLLLSPSVDLAKFAQDDKLTEKLNNFTNEWEIFDKNYWNYNALVNHQIDDNLMGFKEWDKVGDKDFNKEWELHYYEREVGSNLNFYDLQFLQYRVSKRDSNQQLSMLNRIYQKIPAFQKIKLFKLSMLTNAGKVKQVMAQHNIYRTEEDQNLIYVILHGSVIFQNKNEVSKDIYKYTPFFSVYEGYQIPAYQHLKSFRNNTKDLSLSQFKHSIKEFNPKSTIQDYNEEFEETIKDCIKGICQEDTIFFTINKDKYKQIMTSKNRGTYKDQDRLDLLKRFGPFRNTQDIYLAQLIHFCKIKKYKQGQTIIKQGEPIDCFRIIEFGTCQIYFEYDENKPYPLRKMTRGEGFGHRIFFNKQQIQKKSEQYTFINPYYAQLTVKADSSQVKMLEFSKDLLSSFYDTAIMENIIKEMINDREFDQYDIKMLHRKYEEFLKIQKHTTQKTKL